MKRALIDLSSVVWTCLLAGKDKEFGREYTDAETGKTYFVNSASYGYENAIEHLTIVMKDIDVQPHQMVFVPEGRNSKDARKFIHEGYKAGRDKRPEYYEQFNKVKEQLLEAFLGLGAQAAWQDNGVEADDVLGYLALNLEGERWIVSGDKDLAQVVGGDIHHYRSGSIDENPFGEFPHRYIPVYIALVGDASDKIPGARGFGDAAFTKMLVKFGMDSLPMMEALIKDRKLDALDEDVAEMKELQRVMDDHENVYMSYELGRLRVESINTMRRPLQWRVGMVKPRSACQDDRLRKYAGQVHLVSREKYAEIKEWARKQIELSPYVALDIETSTPPESDEWLAQQDKDDGSTVDVFGSELTSLQMTFGPNLQYTVYLPYDNVPVPGITNLDLDQIVDFVDMVPRHKITYVHNAQFELPICYMTWGARWAGDGEYHGFLRNVRDTRIGSSYVDENRKANLKLLSKDLLGYEQTNYDQVTTKRYFPASKWLVDRDGGYEVERGEEECNGELIPWVKVKHKMNELTAEEVLDYGADDTICTAALANHFRTVMEIEKTWHVYEEVETLPAYLTALAFVQGVDFSLEHMAAMEKDDNVAYDAAWATLRTYLISIGFEGTQCPVYTELEAATIKEAFEIAFGRPLKTLVRTPDKLRKLIEQECNEGKLEGMEDDAMVFALLIGEAIKSGDLRGFNQFVASRFSGEPQLDLASPKQMKALLYDHMGIPVQIINDVTPLERQNKPDLADAVTKFKRKRAGSSDATITESDLKLLRVKAKTDDTAIDFCLAFDAAALTPEAIQALKAVQTMKKVMTRRSLFYKTYWKVKHWKDGKIHASMNQCAAVTRRYSSSAPNLQQVPKKGEAVRFRGAFRPHHRNAVIGSIDFTGQELRLAAERSQDKNMLACYIGEHLKDIHSLTAAGAMKLKWGAQAVKDAYSTHGNGITDDYDLFLHLRKLGKSDPMGKKADDLRKDSKNVNFAAQFGAKAPKISETLIMPLEDAQIFLDARSAMFPDVEKAAERAANEAKRTGYALTMMGARRHLREAMLSDEHGAADRAARQAWNMEIQGSAAEMTKLAMARLWRTGALFKYDVRFIAPIHDELVTSVHRDHAVEFLRIKHQCMTAPYADMQVPILGSISVGPDFAEQHECGDWFIEENIRAALNDIFAERAAA